MGSSSNNLPDFPSSLVAFDFLPCIFCTITLTYVSSYFNNLLFYLGSFLILFAGFCKAIWKLIALTSNKDIQFLFWQMRISMPLGLVIIILSLILAKVKCKTLKNYLFQKPSVFLIFTGGFGLVLMIIFFIIFDKNNITANWIEEIVNAISQGCLMVGILIVKINKDYEKSNDNKNIELNTVY